MVSGICRRYAVPKSEAVDVQNRTFRKNLIIPCIFSGNPERCEITSLHSVEKVIDGTLCMILIRVFTTRDNICILFT
jgi:hypothetical protein